MVKKIGNIKGVPVVEGHPNEIKKNEIHYKEDNGILTLSKRGNNNKLESISGGTTASEGNSALKFYKIDLSTEAGTLIGSVLNAINTVSVICKYNEDLKDNKYYNVSKMLVGGTSSTDTLDCMDYSVLEPSTIKAFCLSTKEATIGLKEGNTFKVTTFSGDLTSQLIMAFSSFLAEQNMSEEDKEMFKQMINLATMEISEEEYYNLLEELNK